jgi:hypothetical protein
MQIDRVWVGPGGLSRSSRFSATVALVVGGLLIVWSSYIHFHLWQKIGYRHIPTIGPLFILQSIVGLMVGILVIGVRRVWAAVLGVGFALSTLIGFLITVEHGLFGFRDQWSAPFGAQAFAIELATILVLGFGIAVCLTGHEASDRRAVKLAGLQP